MNGTGDESGSALAALAGALGTGEIDQDMPHQTRGKAEEMNTVAPFTLRAAHETDESFINQCRGLQHMARVSPIMRTRARR